MAKLTKADAARQLGISRTTLYKLIDQGNRVIRRPRVYQRSTRGDNAKETVTRFVKEGHAMV